MADQEESYGDRLFEYAKQLVEAGLIENRDVSQLLRFSVMWPTKL